MKASAGFVTPRQELNAYESALPSLLPKHEGQYVVIKGDQLLMYSATYDEALSWAYDRFGLDEPFFVKKISADYDVLHFTRDIGPCRR